MYCLAMLFRKKLRAKMGYLFSERYIYNPLICLNFELYLSNNKQSVIFYRLSPEKEFTKLTNLVLCRSHLGRGSRAAKGIRL
ncbi:hypothetical protein CUC53_09190 [Aeromonas cavernicola]|uniref:Uncharacterized protein n=1 Tax=Aeromonas cavernicola TaxID=1006623 RepID=A0A2H9U4T3_9GAMM|nr:hypothetical protein CUC53_09190 [Aeromonas cavernicola]